MSIGPSFKTEMPNTRPRNQEITDYIIDLLHDEPETHRQCCLVSRIWVPRTRKHLFGTIRFKSSADLDARKKAFQNSLSSPTYHTRCLVVNCTRVAATILGEPGRVQSFSNVVRLELSSYFTTPLYSEVFGFISSLPLLEDLEIKSVRVCNDACVFQHSTSPPSTGTLGIYVARGMEFAARQLLDLPNGCHFRRLDCAWYLEDDVRWVRALVEGCAGTLQYVHLERDVAKTSRAGPIDFPKATKLREVTFRPRNLGDVSTAVSLRTLTSDHRDLRQVLIYVPVGDSSDDRLNVGEIQSQ
ncbi:hypothetical protein BJ322DRAFT_769114 [Thelephora terrestris]|uniref:Uncharacterized protein n=1 Tax=Thelephora terrestris TaxID=56493 RepID=A0A9P6HFJ4_9AGAM|nr:hypothetical protein BJ322DRAFT_769114 [Thelephora terrestris]